MKDGKVRYRERLSARRVLEWISKVPEKSQSQKNKQSLAWTQAKLRELEEGTYKNTAVKRQWSTEANSPRAQKQNSSYRTNLKYSAILKDSIQMVVMDRSDTDGSISLSKWRRVENSLAEVFLDCYGGKFGNSSSLPNEWLVPGTFYINNICWHLKDWRSLAGRKTRDFLP